MNLHQAVAGDDRAVDRQIEAYPELLGLERVNAGHCYCFGGFRK